MKDREKVHAADRSRFQVLLEWGINTQGPWETCPRWVKIRRRLEPSAPTNIARPPGRSKLSEIYRCWQSHMWLREHFSPRLPGKRKKKGQNSLSCHFLVVILLSCSVPLWCLTTHSPELGELRPENGKWEEGVFVDHDGCGIRESPWVPRSPLNKQTGSTSSGWAGPPGQVTSALDSLNL